MEMPDTLKVYQHYTDVSPHNNNFVLSLHAPEYPDNAEYIYYSQSLMDAKDAEIARLEAIIESRGM